FLFLNLDPFLDGVARLVPPIAHRNRLLEFGIWNLEFGMRLAFGMRPGVRKRLISSVTARRLRHQTRAEVCAMRRSAVLLACLVGLFTGCHHGLVYDPLGPRNATTKSRRHEERTKKALIRLLRGFVSSWQKM